MTIYIYEGTFYALLLWAPTSLRGWCSFYSAQNKSIKKLEKAFPYLSQALPTYSPPNEASWITNCQAPRGYLKEPGQASKFWCLTFYKSATITILHGINQWTCVEYFNDAMFSSTSIFKDGVKFELLI